MKKSPYSEHQIIQILKEAEAGKKRLTYAENTASVQPRCRQFSAREKPVTSPGCPWSQVGM